MTDSAALDDRPRKKITESRRQDLRVEYTETLQTFHRQETLVYAGVVFLIAALGTILALIAQLDTGAKQTFAAGGTLIILLLSICITAVWAERQYTANDLRAFRIREIEEELGLRANTYIHLADESLTSSIPPASPAFNPT